MGRRCLSMTLAVLPAMVESQHVAADRETRRAELLLAQRGAAAAAGQADAAAVLSDLFAARGVYVTPTPLLLQGAGAVRAWLERDTLTGRSRARWITIWWDVSADGRDGFTVGYFDVIRAGGDTAFGKFHAYWRREASGRWRILALSRGRRGAGPPDTIVAPARTAVVQSWTGDTGTTLRQVFAAEAAFADSVGVDVGRAFATFAEPDAAKLGGAAAAYVFGRNAIRDLFVGARPGSGPRWRPEAGSVAASNDLAFTFGPYWPGAEGPDPGAQPRNRYFTIWRRQPDGTWRYVVD